jgi:hypothetical protein
MLPALPLGAPRLARSPGIRDRRCRGRGRKPNRCERMPEVDLARSTALPVEKVNASRRAVDAVECHLHFRIWWTVDEERGVEPKLSYASAAGAPDLDALAPMQVSAGEEVVLGDGSLKSMPESYGRRDSSISRPKSISSIEDTKGISNGKTNESPVIDSRYAYLHAFRDF